MGNKESFKMGTIDMLMLKILSEGDCYGYELAQIVETLSEGVITVTMGTMYPTLYKLASKGYVTDYTKKVGVRRERQYYHLEKEGREELERLMDSYNKITKATQKVLAYTCKKEIEKDVM